MFKINEWIQKNTTRGILVCSVLLCTLIVSMGVCAIYPEKQMEQLLQNGNYDKAVNIYNENYAGTKKDYVYEEKFLDAIDEIQSEWKRGEIGYKDAILELKELAGIDNSTVAEKAKYMSDHIEIEGTGLVYYNLAQTCYEKGDYIAAMKHLIKIEESYLAYEDVKILYEQNQKAILNASKQCEDINEMEDWIVKLENYYEEISEIAFLTRKEQMEREVLVEKEVLNILKDASSKYDDKDYKGCFTVLHEGMECYPEELRIQVIFDKCHYTYVASVTEKVYKACEEELYEDAYAIVAEGREVHECEEFQELLEYIKEKESFWYRWKKKISSFFDWF